MSLLIKNVYTHGKLMELEHDDPVNINLLIENNFITNISNEEITGKFSKVIDGGGAFISPGLCDPQVHFREPGLEYKEDIASGSKAAVKGGFTSVVSMPNTTPTADNYETVKFMWDKQAEVGLCRVYPTGAVSLGLAGKELADFGSLKDAGAIALTDDGKGIQSDELFEQAMTIAKELDLPLLDHSEDESLSAGGAIHLGEVSKKNNIKGIDSRSESVHVKRGCDISEKTGAHYHVLHISTAESIEHVKVAKAKGLNVTAEVSPHHLLLCDEDIPKREDGGLDANWKMNPPLRSKADREACQKALLEGVINAIATDHAPHSPKEKAMEIEKAPFGIIGLETAFPLMYTHFVKTNKLSLSQLIDLMSKQAGAIFKLNTGRLVKGAVADISLFDLQNTIVIEEEYFASKSKNSPFIGQKLYGATKLTIMNGNIVYHNI